RGVAAKIRHTGELHDHIVIGAPVAKVVPDHNAGDRHGLAQVELNPLGTGGDVGVVGGGEVAVGDEAGVGNADAARGGLPGGEVDVGHRGGGLGRRGMEGGGLGRRGGAGGGGGGRGRGGDRGRGGRRGRGR